MGCYLDNNTSDLPNDLTPAGYLSIDSCLNVCLKNGYRYAGGQKG